MYLRILRLFSLLAYHAKDTRGTEERPRWVSPLLPLVATLWSSESWPQYVSCNACAAVHGSRMVSYRIITRHMGVSKNRAIPKWKTLFKLMIWGYHYFRKHPYIDSYWYQFLSCNISGSMKHYFAKLKFPQKCCAIWGIRCKLSCCLKFHHNSPKYTDGVGKSVWSL